VRFRPDQRFLAPTARQSGPENYAECIRLAQFDVANRVESQELLFGV